MGEEFIVPTLYLDVIVIRANRKSKLFFQGPYDANNVGPPTCFSDNGIGPSSNALQPQSERCLPCLWNQMNSKINPETGKGSKACSDRTKLAVIIPGDSIVNVYELQVPPKSLTPLNEYINFLKQQADKPDISELVTRLEFNDTASHPMIKFSPVRWVRDDPHDVQMIDYIYDQRLDENVVGLNDVPADPEVVRQAQQLRNGAAGQFQLPSRQEVARQKEAAPPNPVYHGMAGAQQAQTMYHQGAQTAQADPYAQEPAPKPRGRPKKPVEALAAPTASPIIAAAPMAGRIPMGSPPAGGIPMGSPPAGGIPGSPPAGGIPGSPPAGGNMPDIPDFLRRAQNQVGVAAQPPQQPPQAATLQPPPPQFGMARALPPPPSVSAALDAAMRMPPRR
jgi:hypothetical protein